MTRAKEVRYLRTTATMAYPHGRLLSVRSGVTYALAPDGWMRLGRVVPAAAVPLTRQEADEWCQSHGWDRAMLDAVPS